MWYGGVKYKPDYFVSESLIIECLKNVDNPLSLSDYYHEYHT